MTDTSFSKFFDQYYFNSSHEGQILDERPAGMAFSFPAARPASQTEITNSRPPGKDLNLGCGTGTHALTLVENGWWSPVFILLSEPFEPPAAVRSEME